VLICEALDCRPGDILEYRDETAGDLVPLRARA
jgi:DNA-binding Xre family transcriptional regulator